MWEIMTEDTEVIPYNFDGRPYFLKEMNRGVFAVLKKVEVVDSKSHLFYEGGLLYDRRDIVEVPEQNTLSLTLERNVIGVGIDVINFLRKFAAENKYDYVGAHSFDNYMTDRVRGFPLNLIIRPRVFKAVVNA